MYYILNFMNHRFVTADSLKDCVREVIKMIKLGVNRDSIEIVCAFQEDVRLTVSELLDESNGGCC